MQRISDDLVQSHSTQRSVLPEVSKLLEAIYCIIKVSVSGFASILLILGCVSCVRGVPNRGHKVLNMLLSSSALASLTGLALGLSTRKPVMLQAEVA